MSADEDIRTNLAKYEKFKGGEPEKVMLYHKLKLENLKIISDKSFVFMARSWPFFGTFDYLYFIRFPEKTV